MSHPTIPHGTEFFTSCYIQNIQYTYFFSYCDLFFNGFFQPWVILIYKDIVKKLNYES
uniref:Uncharacterized protein n=1 Tax=Arcella intermedia TaxID=1963864 RepID=A0A6B2LW43_9EUKA